MAQNVACIFILISRDLIAAAGTLIIEKQIWRMYGL